MSRAARLVGLPPVLGPAPRVLVLGSMPGAASLAAGQYYAHPRNAFWILMGDLAGAGPELDYAARLARLTEAGIALWDVIGACRRRGSLDSAIDPRSIEVNDIAALLDATPSLARVLLNGGLAATLFRRHLLASVAALGRTVTWHALPSTSPANAAWSLARKRAAWRAALRLARPRAGTRTNAGCSR